VHTFLRSGEYLKDLGEGGFFPVKSNITAAIYSTLDPDICRNCKTRIFAECHSDILPGGVRRLRLMFATDGGEYSRAPRDLALEVARSMGVTLDIMTMTPPDASPELAQTRLAAVRQEAEKLGVLCEDVLMQGTDPVKAVALATEQANTLLLVIGRTPPKGKVDRMVGTHAARIIDEAPCNILITPKQAGIWKQRILVGFDANPSTDIALELTISLAKASGVPVTLCSVVKPSDPATKVLGELLESAATTLRLEGVDVDTRIETGTPAEALRRVAEEIGADLIVLGKRHGGLYRLLPNTPTDQLIGANRWPVLIAKMGRTNSPISKKVRA
jgi:nucleotide-binding universal stress UspA family protein